MGSSIASQRGKSRFPGFRGTPRNPGLMRGVGGGRRRGRGGNGPWPGARSEERQPTGAAPEAQEPPWRPAEIIAALCKLRDQFVGDVDLDGRLLGAGPELLHGLAGLLAELAVDAALEAVEPPQLGLRLPDLFGRI